MMSQWVMSLTSVLLFWIDNYTRNYDRGRIVIWKITIYSFGKNIVWNFYGGNRYVTRPTPMQSRFTFMTSQWVITLTSVLLFWIEILFDSCKTNGNEKNSFLIWLMDKLGSLSRSSPAILVFLVFLKKRQSTLLTLGTFWHISFLIAQLMLQ